MAPPARLFFSGLFWLLWVEKGNESTFPSKMLSIKCLERQGNEKGEHDEERERSHSHSRSHIHFLSTERKGTLSHIFISNVEKYREGKGESGSGNERIFVLFCHSIPNSKVSFPFPIKCMELESKQCNRPFLLHKHFFTFYFTSLSKLWNRVALSQSGLFWILEKEERWPGRCCWKLSRSWVGRFLQILILQSSWNHVPT